MTEEQDPGKHEVLFNQVHNFNKKSVAFLLFFGGLSALWLYVWFFEVIGKGLQVTGMNRPVYWGMFIMSFIYFIGLSHAGTLISAILRVTKAEWRRPLTRIAEAITVFVLVVGASMVLWDVGRPIRALLYLPLHGRFQSPLVWDFAAITTYITMSITFLYVALIPDIAHLRDRVNRGKWFYELLALNFTGTREEWHQYEKSMFLLSVGVIPVAVSVHTVVSFIFSMEPKPLWHETIFGPFFVTGALFSGVATIIVAMFFIRKYHDMEEYLDKRLFNNLGLLLLSLSMIWMYFIVAEHLTTFYGNEPLHMAVFSERVYGRYQPMFVAMIVLNFVIPFFVLIFKRTILWTTIASFGVLIGMYFERFLILAPTFVAPRLPLFEPRWTHIIHYIPTWQEIVSLVGGFAFFIFLYYIFVKLFPAIPYSEVQEEDRKALEADGDIDLGYKKPDSTDRMRKGQRIIVWTYFFLVAGFLATLVKLIYNSIIFGPWIQEIEDISLFFAIGANLFYMPAVLIALYAFMKLGLQLTSKEDTA